MMNFEEALRYELATVPNLNNKVFPIYAKQETKPPFLVYRKTGLVNRKTHKGFSQKAEADYNITLLSKSYEELQSITAEVIGKLQGFWGREIGVDGPYVEDINVALIGDQYEYEADMLRSDITIKAFY